MILTNVISILWIFQLSKDDSNQACITKRHFYSKWRTPAEYCQCLQGRKKNTSSHKAGVSQSHTFRASSTHAYFMKVLRVWAGHLICVCICLNFPGVSDGKEYACNAGVQGLILGLVRFPWKGNGYQLQYFCLENSMDRGTWWATVHGVTESDMTD